MKIKKYIRKSLYILIAITLLWQIQDAAAQLVSCPFDTVNWNIVSGKIMKHLGRNSFMGIAELKGVELQNGIIEVDIAVKHQRGYPGIMFRIESNENYERFYIRPHRAPFYPDALQYTPTFNKVSGWQLYHGDGYTAGAEIPPDCWNHLRIEIKGTQARTFWNNMRSPALEIDELKHGLISGKLGVFGPADSSAWFSNFRYRKTIEVATARYGTRCVNNCVRYGDTLVYATHHVG